MGSVGSSWVWERATEWQASKTVRRTSFLIRAIAHAGQASEAGPGYFRADDGRKPAAGRLEKAVNWESG
jgi:hypothetical protein